MATQVALIHSASGMTKTAYYGFSWTSLFFGFLPALFRGDLVTFLVGFAISIVIAFLTFGIGIPILWIAWALFYNRYHTRKLLEKGYVLQDGQPAARIALGIV